MNRLNMKLVSIYLLLTFTLQGAIYCTLFAQESAQRSVYKPDAIIDLGTEQGAQLVKGQWRTWDASIVAVPFHAVGSDLKPTGPAIQTYEIQPKAFAVDFNDGSWPILPASALESRKGTGRLSFAWYRLLVTVPEKVGALDPTGTTVIFEIVVDDYAEVWVNGKQDIEFGKNGGGAIAGYNARNRVILTHNAMPGDKFQIAVLGANGPLSNLPDNYIWIRSATLDFHKNYAQNLAWKNLGKMEVIDPALNQVIAADTKAEKLADGFQFTEGPSWHPNGFLIFSDPNTNTLYALQANGDVSVLRTKSGYTGLDIGQYGQPGSNGTAFDKEGRLTMCQHGNHRIVRIEKNGTTTILADSYEGKRLNSPNDLVYRSDGALYFTDPPYGLPKFFEDERKALKHSGVYCIINGQLKLVSTDLKGPNGIAFTPDEKYLYVTNWDITDIKHTKVIMRYEVKSDGSLTAGKVFFSMNDATGEEALDGMKVDSKGNLFVSGPGAVWVISSEAKLLGKLVLPELPANFAWGDEDFKSLYMTGRSGVYKVRTVNAGTKAW